MQKQKIIILMLTFIALENIHPQTIPTYQATLSFSETTKHLSNEEVQILRSGEALSQTSKSRDKKRVQYMPSLQYFKSISNFIHTHKPTILYETLYFISIKNHEKQSHTMVSIFNYFQDVSNFVNIYYKNIKKGHIHPLFLSSKHVISETNTTATSSLMPIAAKSYHETDMQETQEEIITVLQDMPPFGNVTSYYHYQYENRHMAFKSINTTPISYRGIEAVKPEHMLSAAYILRTDEGILIYGIGAVRITGIAVLFSGVIANSFESRMVGLFSWVKNEYEGKPQLK